MDALSPSTRPCIDLEVQPNLMVNALFRLLATGLGDRFRTAWPASQLREFVEASASVDISDGRIEVALGRRVRNPHLIEAGSADSTSSVPWLHNHALKIKFA